MKKNIMHIEYKQHHYLQAIPIEGMAFIATAVISRVILPFAAAPLMGIGTALVATTLVLKVAARYTPSLVIKVTKDACRCHKKYPKLRLIAFLFSMAIGFLSNALGMLCGGLLGGFGAIILDVEHYKRKQKQCSSRY